MEYRINRYRIRDFNGRKNKKIKNFFTETFFLTYGDGVSDVNIKKLLEFHLNHKKSLTVTAVKPPARFGYLSLKDNNVTSFSEKVDTADTWINGGFFVAEPKIFDFIENDKTIFEKEPLEQLAKKNELKAFKHSGFWQCMDHKIDKVKLDKLCEDKSTLAEMKKVLIFGGTGFLGYHLCKKSLIRNLKVFSVSKNPVKKKRKLSKVKYIYFDASKFSNFKRINQNFDFIINSSGYGSHFKGRKGKKLYNEHISIAKNILKFLKKKRLKN